MHDWLLPHRYKVTTVTMTIMRKEHRHAAGNLDLARP